MKPVLIFDYDGTLHYNLTCYIHAFKLTYEWLLSEGVATKKEVTEDMIAGWQGLNPVDTWNTFQPGLPEDYRTKAIHMLGRKMDEMALAGKAEWYEGTETALDEIKDMGYKMVILSNCRIAYGEAHWKSFNIGRWMDRFYTAEEFGYIPKTEIVEKIREDYPGDFIIIGDRIKDMECARSSGSPFIACTYGFAPTGELDDAKYFADDVRDIPKILNTIK